MAKFIELYEEGRTILLNADQITAIAEHDKDYADIYMIGDDEPTRVNTSLDDICKQLERLTILADID